MRASGIDTEPHPVFSTYSAANFAEVAPDRLSIAAWSLIGPPVERAMRRLVSDLWPNASWQTGSHFVFVGYFGCRPYHNLAALCHMADQVPWLSPADFTQHYFEGAEPPRAHPGLGMPRLARWLATPRLATTVADLRARLNRVEGEVALLEGRSRRADADQLLLGETFQMARQTLDRAWSVHMRVTACLPALLSLQQALGRRFAQHFDEVEPWLNRPEELVWSRLGDASTQANLISTEFLRRPFYEVADEYEPWSRYVEPPSEPRTTKPTDPHFADPGSVIWDMAGHGSLRALRGLTRLVTDTMASRELGKSLAMRVLHVMRTLLPLVAAARGVAGDGWTYLTLDELSDPKLVPELAARVAERRVACATALKTPMPDLVDTRVSTPSAQPPDERRRQGRGVSNGQATGFVVGRSLDGLRTDRSAVLVCDALDAGVGNLLDHVDGVVTVRGSLLSHVAILVRERGIPAVVGHPLASELRPGELVRIDGGSGDVTRIAA